MIKLTLRFIILIFEIFKEYYFERKLNVCTDEKYLFENKFGLYKDGIHYEPTTYYLLEKVIKYLKLKPEDMLVDFGCGKGRVVFFCGLEKLKKVIGIEVNKELIDIANKNLATFRADKTVIQFINEDAAKFNIKDENIFFMFNPFGCKTVQAVVDNIKNSLIDNPRLIRILYNNPVCKSLLDSQDWLVLEKKIDKRCMIWRNKKFF